MPGATGLVVFLFLEISNSVEIQLSHPFHLDSTGSVPIENMIQRGPGAEKIISPRLVVIYSVLARALRKKLPREKKPSTIQRCVFAHVTRRKRKRIDLPHII